MSSPNDIVEKIKKVNTAWHFYFYVSSFCQQNINFNDEARTNYIGDLLANLTDTLDLIKVYPKGDFQQNVANSTVLLQTLYIHQDLMDELLKVFNLEGSVGADKIINRKIRNELVGHPLSRRKGSLESSTIWSVHTSNEVLQYAKYARVNNYEFELVKHPVIEVVERHWSYLRTYLEKLLNYIKDVLRDYVQKLELLKNSLKSELSLLESSDFIFENYEEVVPYDFTFKNEYLKQCQNKRDEHPRYAFIVNYFYNSMHESLLERIQTLYVFLDIPTESSTTENFNQKKLKRIRKEIDYGINKLFEKHPIWNAASFRQFFPDNQDIQDELTHMEQNMDNLDYYCACRYMVDVLIPNNS